MTQPDTNIKHQIISDGRTVWINAVDGECVGRFSKFGIDVHTTARKQMAGEGECLHCTHEKPDANGWTIFQKEMLHHHDVDIGDEHMPEFAKI